MQLSNGTFHRGSSRVRVCTHRQEDRFVAIHYPMILLQDKKGDTIMHLDVRNSGTLSVLTLPGDLNRRHAETLRIYLRRSLDQAGRLIVDCEQVSTVDPDCLSILCAAYRISRVLQKDFVVAGQRPGPFLKAVKEVDRARCRACDLETGDACLWHAR